MTDSQTTTNCDGQQPDRPRRQGRFRSLRRFLPRFERSSSQPPGLKKSGSGVRASFSFGGGLHKVGQKVPGEGIPGLFHSLTDPCAAADEELPKEKAEVIVKDIADQTVVLYPDSKRTLPNGQPARKPCRAPPPPIPISQDPKSDYQKSIKDRRKSCASPVLPEPSVFTTSLLSQPGPDQCKDVSPVKPPVPVKRSTSEKRRVMEDRYNQMALSHLSTLAFVAEHFASLSARWRHCLPSDLTGDSLRWADFVISPNSPILLKDSAVFYNALLKRTDGKYSVNLMISPAKFTSPFPKPASQQPYFLPTLAEFQDHIPSQFVSPTDPQEYQPNGQIHSSPKPSLTLCKVSVLPDTKLASLRDFAAQTASRHHPLKLPTFHEKETCFVMIQLISAFKFLQSQGIEEVGRDLDGLILLLKEGDSPHLVLLYEWLVASGPDDFLGNDEEVPRALSLCQSALAVLCLLLHVDEPTDEVLRNKHVPLFGRMSVFSEGFQKVATILHLEKANSLTQAKALLEHLFWITSARAELLGVDSQEDDEEGSNLAPKFESEFAAKLWLDVERAKVVNGIVRALLNDRKALDLPEEYRVHFLLHASVKQLFESAQTLDSACEVIV